MFVHSGFIMKLSLCTIPLPACSSKNCIQWYMYLSGAFSNGSPAMMTKNWHINACSNCPTHVWIGWCLTHTSTTHTMFVRFISLITHYVSRSYDGWAEFLETITRDVLACSLVENRELYSSHELYSTQNHSHCVISPEGNRGNMTKWRHVIGWSIL